MLHMQVNFYDYNVCHMQVNFYDYDVCHMQVNFYDYNNPGRSTVPGEQIGHFINLIWKNTGSLGCGWTRCDNRLFSTWPTTQVMVTCQYRSGANFDDQTLLRANVLRPTSG
jgi:Cysteine-rich secretory protein family